MKSFLAFTIFLIVVNSVAAQAQSTPPRSAVKANNEGVKALSEQRQFDAYKAFLKGLKSAPFQPELHMNLGFTFETNKEFEKAAQTYLAAASLTQDSESQFQAYFNAGNAYGAAKKIPEALSAYQKALSIKPDSIEIKTNIELLLSQQGGGGGQGDQQNDQQQDNQGDQQKQDQQNPQDNKGDKKEKKPQEFKSESLTQDDVRRILEELKGQEQKIRAKQQEGKGKEKDNGKDW